MSIVDLGQQITTAVLNTFAPSSSQTRYAFIGETVEGAEDFIAKIRLEDPDLINNEIGTQPGMIVGKEPVVGPEGVEYYPTADVRIGVIFETSLPLIRLDEIFDMVEGGRYLLQKD